MLDDKYISKFKENYKIIENGCWEWIGKKDKDGYGRIYVGRKGSSRASKVSWMIYRKENVDNYSITTTCGNRLCVNPSHLLLKNRLDMPILERFESKFEKLNNEECWNWKGNISEDGYGYLSYLGKKVRAHRTAWVLYNGEDPGELLVCHHCDNPVCVNPSHLFLGTINDNVQDMIIKGRKVVRFGEDHWARKDKDRAARLIKSNSENRYGKLQRGKDHWTTRMPEKVLVAANKRRLTNLGKRAK